MCGNPCPFLKWAGGKRQLLSQIDPFLPKDFEYYIEPFVGGGALFFYLLPKKAVLIDNNPFLINTYQVIKENIEELIELLRNHKNIEDYYYKIRNADRKPDFKNWSDVKKVSRIIFLNRCCYNGLYRVNSKGYFNVPFGKYKNPNFCNEVNLRAVHEILQNVEIIHDSFERCLDFADEETFLYFDPPYSPLSKTANFTSYTKENFNREDQIKLKISIDKLTECGCKVMLSNSSNEFILNLYEEYSIKEVRAKRMINSNALKRGEVKEVLILNY
ncbi:MAG: DNA adenine methylase [Candidatus Lokiarchaeota archaeon]|nr:DNA adenine methylase [Candidatus Lokiarchaeota archaeon]